MLRPKVVENVAPRSSCPEATGFSLTHSSVFLRTCPSMGSSTRDDDGAGVVCADPIQGASQSRDDPHRGEVGPLALAATFSDFFVGWSGLAQLLHIALLDYLIRPPQ